MLRSNVNPYNSELCVICQSEGGKLHKVMTKANGQQMFNIATNLKDNSFLVRLNTPSDATDAVANDVQYHQRCWVYAQRSVCSIDVDIVEIEQSSRVVADIEILNAIKCELSNPTGVILNMKNINTTYINLLNDNKHSDIGINYKRYLEQLIIENIPDIEFIKPTHQNESEKLCDTQKKHAIVDSALENVSDDLHHIFEAAKAVRKDLLTHTPWIFTGSFEDYVVPDMLSTLIKWIVVGQVTGIETTSRKGQVDRTVKTLTQIVSQAVKSNRQMSYKPKKTAGSKGNLL